MSLKNLYQSDTIDIVLDTEYGWLDVNWKGQQTIESIHLGGEKMLEHLLRNKCSKVLNDNTNVIGYWPQTKWAGEEWFPAMAEAGLKYFAWIFPHSIEVRISTNDAMLNTPKDFYQRVHIRSFTDMSSAKNWLIDIDKKL